MSKNQLLFKSVICVLAFALMLGGAIYLAVRPISYNMEYFGETNDEYGYFDTHRYYTRDGFLIIKNTNFDLPSTGFYYYKDGYIFDLMAENEEQYAEEIKNINTGWEEALEKEFYTSRINSYTTTFIRPDGVKMVYFCKDAIILTSVCAAMALITACLSCTYFVRYRKAKKEEQQAAE